MPFVPYDWQRERCFETGEWAYDFGDECTCESCTGESFHLSQHELAHLAYTPEDGDGEEVSLDNAVWLWRERLSLFEIPHMINRLAQEASLFLATREREESDGN